MESLIYLSSAKTKFSEQQLIDLLDHARHNNLRHEITGVLAYWDGNFIQYIEGPSHRLDQLMTNLKGDPRHGGIITLQRRTIGERAFPEWRMAFSEKRSTGQWSGDRGVSDFLCAGVLHADPRRLSAEARVLLDSFRNQRR